MTAFAANLEDLTLSELKARQRELTNRWMDEQVASEKTNFCLTEGCDNRCTERQCDDCISRQRVAVNEELGRRNREFAPPEPEPQEEAPEEVEEDAEDDLAEAEEVQERPQVEATAKRRCSVCNKPLAKNNRIGICSRTAACKNTAQVARYAQRHGAPAGTAKPEAPAKAKSAPAAPATPIRDDLKSTLANLRERVERQYREGLAAIDRVEQLLEGIDE